MTQVVGVQVPPPAPTLRSPQKTAPRGPLFTLLCPLPIPVLSVCPAPAPAIRVRFLSRGTSATAAIGFGILLRWIWRRRRNGYWRRQERGRGERRKRVGVLRHDGWGKAVSARCIRLAAHLRMYWAAAGKARAKAIAKTVRRFMVLGSRRLPESQSPRCRSWRQAR